MFTAGNKQGNATPCSLLNLDSNTTAQIGYGTKQWGAALGYRYPSVVLDSAPPRLWRVHR